MTRPKRQAHARNTDAGRYPHPSPQASKRQTLPPRATSSAPFSRTQTWTFARRASPGTLPPPPSRPKSSTVSPWADSRPTTVDYRQDTPDAAPASLQQSASRSGVGSAPSPRRGKHGSRQERTLRGTAAPGSGGAGSDRESHPPGQEPAFPPSPPPSPARDFPSRPAYAGPDWDHLSASGRSPSPEPALGVNVSQVNVEKRHYNLRKLEESYGIPIKTHLTISGVDWSDIRIAARLPAPVLESCAHHRIQPNFGFSRLCIERQSNLERCVRRVWRAV